MNAQAESVKPSVKQRFWEEMRKYALVSLYLWVCFGVLLMYEAAILKEHGTAYLPYGVALVKALVIGKFLLIGDAIKVGSRAMGPTMLHRILWKTLAFLLMLIAFTFLEEIVVGWFHGQTFSHSAAEYFNRNWLEILAPDLVMLLILIPLITASEFRKTLGSEQFKAHILGRSGG